jgi:hypothetical protein
MTAPAYTRQLIDRRNRGDHPSDVFVAVGWPSEWLQTHVKTSPFARGASIIATPEARAYDFACLRGLSCCVWVERGEDEPRAHEIAAAIMKHQPLRMYVLNAVTGATTWHCVSTEFKVAA